MSEANSGRVAGPRILLIGPKVPPYGGMAIQAGLMYDLLTDEGISAGFLAFNQPAPKGLRLFDHLRGVRPFFRSAMFCLRLWWMIGKYDVLHVLACSWLYFFLIVIPAILIGRIRGKRVVLNYRGGEADHFFGMFGMVLRPFFHLAHIVTAPSSFLVEIIGRRMGVPVQIVPNIVNFDRFVHRERNRLRPRMIVTRHLLKLYDIESVIRAFGLVQSHYPEASLRIVGTGDQEQYLRNLVVTLKLRNVEFLGYVPQPNLPALYNECDILLNASLADNFPGSLVEAAASGLIVLSTAVGGIPFIFENEESALLVKAGDWAGLGQAALRVLGDEKLASRLGAEALRQMRRYDWQSVRKVLYSIYGFDRDQIESSYALHGVSEASETEC